jgi:hypothetical protein
VRHRAPFTAGHNGTHCSGPGYEEQAQSDFNMESAADTAAAAEKKSAGCAFLKPAFNRDPPSRARRATLIALNESGFGNLNREISRNLFAEEFRRSDD